MTSKANCTPANQKGIRVKSRVRAGKLAANHSHVSAGLRVKCRVKAGGITGLNHNQWTARRVA